MKSKNLLSGAIVTYNCKEQIENTVNSLLEHTKKYPIDLYVVDNNSSDGTRQLLEGNKNIKLLPQKENLGFGKGHNQLISREMGKYHAVINPDIIVENDILAQMVDVMEENDDIVMMMPSIYFEDGKEQCLPKKNPTFKRLFMGRLAFLGSVFKKIRDEYTCAGEKIPHLSEIEFCSGCFFLIRSEIFKKTGGFDERYFMYLEDADLSREARKYGKVVFASDFSVKHLWKRESAKSLKYLFIHTSSAFKYLKKWRKDK